MSAKPQDEFDTIKSIDEITRVLKVAITLNIEVYCELTDAAVPTVVELDIRGVSGTHVVFGVKRESGAPGQLLTTAFPKGLQAGSPIEVIFGLVDGQYAIRDVVKDVSMTTFTVDAGKNLLRLQRRKDFRVSVRTDSLTFVTKPDTGDSQQFKLLDLSAGGMRLLWPASQAAIPALGATVFGTLHLNPQKSVDVQVRMVKNHGPDSPSKPDLGHALSFQFDGLSQEDSRAILFVCLFIHRAHYGTR